GVEVWKGSTTKGGDKEVFVYLVDKGDDRGICKVLGWLLVTWCFGVDAIEDFKEYTLRDYYCWLKTYFCWYKLKLLDNVADSRLRMLEESAAADDKMKK
nr:hypothetical protein [Tanacetum cinerariifolium]